ncbi:hypothetical protein A4A49_20748 [Nicotiana attenuata]|uniref:Uncharacterized protein n=1 Tax=Nicotiana attenuata TaxID=49451 RepID=A0A1J6J3W4_NICAT|nr:hypothetical protein A4A49_20748 [Nicotiana attenuata]
MRPSRILRSLSSRLLNSSVVVPLPIQSTFNQRLTKNLNTLQSLEAPCINTTNFLFHLLDVSTATQDLAQESLRNVSLQDSDREIVEEYLEGNATLMDACNSLLDKVDNIGKYVELVRISIHSLECCKFDQPINPMALARAKQGLISCESFERKCKEIMTKSNSGLKKLSVKFAQCMTSSQITGTRKQRYFVSDVEEILSGSSVVTTMLCDIVSVALSFKSKHKLNTTQSGSTASSSSAWLHPLHELQMKIKEEKEKNNGDNVLFSEFQRIFRLTQSLTQKLKTQNQNDVIMMVAELKRSCEEVDEGLKSFEGKIKELHRFLISIRMSLLRTLSSLA